MKRRLVLGITGVAAAAVVLFALPLAVVLQRSYRDEELLRLQRDAVAATRSIDLTPGSPDRIELPRFAGELGIYTTQGTLVTGTGPRVADSETRSALRGHKLTGSTPDRMLVVAVPLLSGERITGVVRTQRSQASVSRRSHRAWLALGGLGAALVALAVLAALALGRRLIRPLDTLAAAARRVGDGDFAARADPTGIPEIDDVGAALNHSSSQVGELVSRERSFTADASHQLRTPLAALRLGLESDALSAVEPSATVTSALEQVDRLQTTIETLLAVARDRPAGERATDLRAAIAELERRWHGVLAAEGRPLHAVIEVEHPVVAMSPAVLAEITEVLIGNAHAHGAGAVSIVVRHARDAYAVDVKDQGSGFGAGSDQAFQRGAGDRHGIGLALAQSLAHSQGARLQITDPGPNPTVTLLIAPV